MNGRQASGPGKRWEEAFLGGVAGLGARMLLAGAGRLLGFKQGPVAVVGGVAGLVGALVGSGLARRQPRAEPALPAGGASKAASEETAHELRALALEQEARSDEGARPRRGPNGRERYWHLQEGSSHTA